MFDNSYVVNECSSNVSENDKDFCSLVGRFMFINGIDELVIKINRKFNRKSLDLDFSVDLFPSIKISELVFFDEFNKTCGFYFSFNSFTIFKAFRDIHNRNKVSFYFR
jgi:hypothetical protein